MPLRSIKVTAVTVIATLLFSTSAFANKGKYFQEMDANSDGRITSAEHDSAAMAKFTKADANGDGMLTKGELVGFMMDEKGKSAQKAQKKMDKKVAMFDANSDGQMTQEEYMNGNKEHFTKMDTDADGALTSEEMNSGMAKMKGKTKEKM